MPRSIEREALNVVQELYKLSAQNCSKVLGVLLGGFALLGRSAVTDQMLDRQDPLPRLAQRGGYARLGDHRVSIITRALLPVSRKKSASLANVLVLIQHSPKYSCSYLLRGTEKSKGLRSSHALVFNFRSLALTSFT